MVFLCLIALFLTTNTEGGEGVIQDGPISYGGTSFVVAFIPPNTNLTGHLYIMNRNSATVCTVTKGTQSDIVNVSGNGQTSFKLGVENSMEILDFDLQQSGNISDGEIDRRKGILINCQRKVQVYVYFNTADYNSSSATPVLPIDFLSTEYSLPLFHPPSKFVTIVAVSDGTTLTIQLESTNAYIRGKFYKQGTKLVFSLDNLEVLHLLTILPDIPDDDGTHYNSTFIKCDSPVAVFLGVTTFQNVSWWNMPSKHFQNLHQITPIIKQGTTYIVPSSQTLTLYFLSGTQGFDTTKLCCYKSPYPNTGSASGLFSFLEDYSDAVDLQSDSPFIVTKFSANDGGIFSTVVPPLSQYGYDYWLPNILPTSTTIRNITIIKPNLSCIS